MESLLNQLSQPIIIALIVIVIVVLVSLIFVARRMRRQASTDDDLAQASIGGPMDYTSLPIEEEPKNWRERFARLSLAGKILWIVLPLLLIVGGSVLVLALQPPPAPPVAPPPVPITMEIRSASLANERTIRVRAATTGMGDGTEVRGVLLADNQPFAWFNDTEAVGRVQRNEVEISLRKLNDAPAASRTVSYTVELETDVNGQVVTANAPLEVPSLHARSFYGETVAVQPTSTAPPAPTAPPATAEPSPTSVPLPAGVPGSAAAAAELRNFPLPSSTVLATINPGDNIAILGRTWNREWLRVRTANNQEGWIAASAVQVDAGAIAQLEPEKLVTVFSGGNIVGEPNQTAGPIGQVAVNEIVELLQKTSAADWYQIKTSRDVTGWVPATLLGIPDDIAARVPVQSAEPAPTTGAVAPTSSAGGTSATGLPATTGPTALVVNGGNIRSSPDLDPNNVLSQVNATETVVLLQRTVDGQWYRIRDIRGIEGWVNSSLLRIAPEVAERVPVT